VTDAISHPLLETRDLSKHYGGVKALSGIDFNVGHHQTVAIVGDNGAGKSTLVKLLSGADQPDSGSIMFDGVELSFRTPTEARQAGIETVYQNLALADDLDVVANLFLGREEVVARLGPLSLLSLRKMRDKARNMLGETGVQIEDLTEPMRSLSGGQRQGVAIARAAGWGSKLIIMDEPTAALGVQETRHVEDMIRGLKDAGISVIIVSHNLRQVFDLVDVIWVLRHGRVAGNRNANEATFEDIIGLITGATRASTQEFA
jgi:fructose transport system ATP-binding protein